MVDNNCTSRRNHDSHDDVEAVAAENLEQETAIGDVIWIKLRKSLWWPAVVVGSNRSDSNKLGDRLTGNVRVRIYGSYKYTYVDPFKWHSEFQIALKQNNGSYQEIFSKALKQDQSGSKSGRAKRKSSKSEGSPNSQKNSKSKSSKQDRKHKLEQDESPAPDGTLSGRSQELSARRTKVMQSLGLIAPSGSPFHKIDII